MVPASRTMSRSEASGAWDSAVHLQHCRHVSADGLFQKAVQSSNLNSLAV